MTTHWLPYRPGRELPVSSRWVDGVEIRQRIYQHRWSERTPESLSFEVDDGDRVRVLRYDDGAVFVECVESGGRGYLG